MKKLIIINIKQEHKLTNQDVNYSVFKFFSKNYVFMKLRITILIRLDSFSGRNKKFDIKKINLFLIKNRINHLKE